MTTSAIPIYLDHHATTPCHPEVIEAMLPFFAETFGNPASIQHAHGRRAATALEEARSVVAGFFDARPNEVYFTAGATEANNIVLLDAALSSGTRVISTEIEHKSVLVPLRQLATRGVRVDLLRPDRDGFVTGPAVTAALDERRSAVRLVSVMSANGEIGTVLPIEEIGVACRAAGVRFHTDATQAVGKVAIDYSAADFISVSAHKLYGPKGIGALIARRGTRPTPVAFGGGQERGVRPGTVNVAGAVGLAKALEIRRREMAGEATRLSELRDRLRERLLSEIDGVTVHGPVKLRLPGNLNVSFRRVDAEALLLAMRRFSLSSGSACSAGEKDPSHVLIAIGATEEEAMTSIRFGLGRSTTQEDVDMLVEDLKANVARILSITPFE